MPWEASIRLTGISMARSRTSTGRGSTSGSHRLAPRGVHFGDDSAARILARGCNDYLSAIRRDRPDRFGAVATLPLPDIEGSLEQIAYALDVLELDGLSVMTNADGSYLGDTRGARVRPPDHVPRRSRTRSVSLTRSSNSSSTRRARSRSSTTATRSPKTQDVKYVFVHAGGTIQYLAPRFAIVDEMDVIPGAQDPWGRSPMSSLASAGTPPRRSATRAPHVAIGHGLANVMFGADYPYLRRNLGHWPAPAREHRRARRRRAPGVLGGSAARLIPGLASGEHALK